MRVLIVGGTGFLGGAVTRAAVTAGYSVTVMTRSGEGVPPEAETLVADRFDPLPDLRGKFDAVIDTCGYTPDMVASLAQAVGPVHYVFVSSISVYTDKSRPGIDETEIAQPATDDDLALAAKLPRQDRCRGELYGPAYGPLKRSCEEQAAVEFADQTSLIRLGLIVGPEDNIERFTWWVRRCDEGGTITVPAPLERSIQLIDVRDAAAFLLLCATKQIAGTFNVTGEVITLGEMLAAVIEETDVPAIPEVLPLKQFLDAGYQPWTDLPLILPDDPTVAHMLNVSIDGAKGAGLTFRSLKQTVRDTLEWDRTRRDIPLGCGLSRDDEDRVRNF